MAVDVASLAVKVDSKDIKKGKLELVKFNKTAEKTEKRVKKTEKATDKMSKAFSKMKVAAVAAGVAITAVGAIATKAASDLEEANSKFLTVFRKQVGAAEKMADELNKSYGQSKREAREYLAAMQDLLVPLGMGRVAAGKLSNQMVKLATDLGSFNNRKTADVMRDMQGAIVGEFETMKKYGVVLNVATVEQKAFAMGLAKSKDEITSQVKALAAYQLMVEGSKDAIGDFKRTSDGYANTSKILTAAWEDMAAALGTKLLPAATAVKKELTEMLNEITKGLDDSEIGKVEKNIEKIQKAIAGQKSNPAFEMFKNYGILVSLTKELAKEQRKLEKLRQEESRKASEGQAKLAIEDAKKAAEQAAKLKAKMDKKISDKSAKLAVKREKQAAEQAAKFRAETLEAAEIEYFRFTQGQLALDKNRVLNLKELRIKEGFDKVKAAELADEAIRKLDKEAADRNKKSAKKTVSVYENMGEILESSLSTVFADALRGDLDSFEDYFSSFTDSLSSMWAQMAAKMLISQSMMPGVSAGGFAGAGVGIAGLAVLSSALNKQNEADEKRFEKLTAAYVQGTQLTGSVLGDIEVKSQSTTTALEEILEVNVAGLEISKEMLKALNFVASNNERLASFIGRRAGGITSTDFDETNAGITTGFMDDIIDANVQFFTLGLDKALGTGLGSAISRAFGSTKRSLIDSGIKVYGQNMADIMEESFRGATFQTIQTTKRRGWKKKSSVSTQFGGLSGDITGGLSAMFAGVGDALSYGADIFGVAMDDMYKRLTIADQQISLKGLTADQAAETIGNFVSKTADAWAQTILSGTDLLNNYQQAGDGAFDTYARLVNETEFFTSSLDSMGIAMSATGVQLVDIAQETIAASGGIESLGSSMSSFYNAFFSDAEKQSNLLGSLKETFSEMNMIMPASREGFKNLVTGLDLTTEQDQERFATLMKMSSTADQFYKTMDKTSQAFTKAKEALIVEVSRDNNYRHTRMALASALESARMGDLTGAMQISGNLGGLSGGPTGARTEIEFRREQLRTIGQLSELEALTGKQMTTEEMSLTELETQTSLLSDISTSLTTVNEPEIISNTSEVNPVAVDNAEIVAELKELKEQILNIGLERLKYAKKSYDIEDKWDNEGLPPERAAV